MFRDENDAGYATRGTDPANELKYIIDFRTKERVYQLATCTGCGMTPWSSVPSAETVCIRCRSGLTGGSDGI